MVAAVLWVVLWVESSYLQVGEWADRVSADKGREI